MKIHIELTSEDVKKMIIQKISEEYQFPICSDDVKIEVKSSQNYKSEWENAHFRAVVNRDTTIPRLK